MVNHARPEQRLVGRDAERALLLESLDAVEGGVGRVMLLAGEAGIGKTRLAADLLVAAARRGFAVLEASAHPLRASLAYAPIVEALRTKLAAMPAAEAAELLSGLDDLGRLLVHPALTVPEPAGDPELARTRMFDAAARLVERIADRQPTLLFVDDLHWADRGSVELLHYIGRTVTKRRVLVLATYRGAELAEGLREWAADVRRNGPGAELVLGPLTDEAVATLAAELLGAAPPARMLLAVTERAKGVPLFVTALVDAGGDVALRSGVLPVVVRDVVLDRLRHLPVQDRRLLEVVAVAGDGGSAEVLTLVWASATGFAAALENLLSEGLVVEHLSGRSVSYRVAHPLYAEVAYAELTAQERRGIHARLAAAVDAVRPDDVLALAPHYLGAGDMIGSDRAIEVLAEAGWRAISVQAFEEALRYLGVAVAEARTLGLIDVVVEQLYGLCCANLGLGRVDDTISASLEGVALIERGASDRRLPWLRNVRAVLESERGNLAAAPHPADPVRATKPEARPATESAAELVARLTFTMRRGDIGGLRTISQQLIAVGDRDPSARSARHLGEEITLLLKEDFAAAKREAQRAVDAHCQGGSGADIMHNRALRELIGLSVLAGDSRSALDNAIRQRQYVAAYGMPLAVCSAEHSIGMVRYLTGDLRAALAAIESGLGIARPAGAPRSLARLLLCKAFLLAECGRLGEATRCGSDAVRAAPADFGQDVGLAALTELAALATVVNGGRARSATAPVAAVVAYEPIVSCLMLLFQGRAAVMNNNRRTASESIVRLRDIGRTAPFPVALADRIEGLLYAARGETHSARTLLDSAANGLDSMNTTVLAAQTRLESLELELGGSAGAAEQISACLTTFDEAKMTGWADRSRRLARLFGMTLPAARRSGPLTMRERQVVDLVSEGLSNADIATRLFLSERTVETHLRNSYARLGLSTRVALAQWVVEHSGSDDPTMHA